MTRQRLNLNRDWRFFRGDIAGGAEAVDFDDRDWQPIGLPHTFDLPYFRTPEFYVGDGWYRKRLEIPPQWRGRRLSLEFDGAFQVAEAFVNGVRLGEHRGGYTGFRFDITEEVDVGGANMLAVRVNNNWDAQLQPRAGEHVFCGGIYRDVHLLVTNTLHIAPNGVVVATPQASRDAAGVRVRTEVHNSTYETCDCTLATEILDPDSRSVASMRSTARTLQWGTTRFDQTSNTIANPLLWHPDHPHLYAVRTQLFAGDTLVDEIETPLGIRWFEWTADRGFFLNGDHFYLRGANAHQDHAGWGIAITRAACERDVRLMKEAGLNFVRGAHYPHHPAFAEACDRLGLLFWSENAFWGKGGFGPEGYWNASAYPVNEADFGPFEQNCKDQLRAMICANRNHASIIAWSMTNEAFFTFNLDRAKSLMSDLVALSRELDPTRPAAIGGAQRGDVDRIGDIAGYNGDGARLFLNPGMPNMVSEYGAISKPHDAYEPFFGELVGATPASPSSPTRGTGDAGVAPTPEEFPWRGGQAIWAGFDYGSIAGKQGLKGIVNHQRVPKRSWYWYRNAYRGIAPPEWPIEGTPARLRLDANQTTIDGTDATDDVQLTVTVLDAAGRRVEASPPITLTIESGPGEFPTGRAITFDANTDIGIADGEAAMAFRSYHGGESVIRATSPGFADATITITTRGEPAFVPGVTPVVQDRPYTPPPESEAARAAMRNAVNVALNRPCRASSEADGHPARMANDGDLTTLWRSSEAESLGWWQVDLEGFYQLASVRLVFEREANYRFIVEMSSDAQAWTPAIDRSGTANAKSVRNDVFDPGAIARYVRVRFVHVPPGEVASLCEIELLGILSVR
jgi:hypothetical protein